MEAAADESEPPGADEELSSLESESDVGVEEESEAVFTETGVDGVESGVAAAFVVVTVAKVVGELGAVYATLEAADGAEEPAGGLATWIGADEPGPT